MGLSVDLVGAAALEQGLLAGMKELSSLDEAKSRAAEMSVRAAEKYVPKKSGQLARSLVANRAFPGSMTSSLPYAPPQHWGWAAKNMKSNLFFVRGARETEHKWLDFFSDEVDDALDHAATKGI